MVVIRERLQSLFFSRKVADYAEFLDGLSFYLVEFPPVGDAGAPRLAAALVAAYLGGASV